MLQRIINKLSVNKLQVNKLPVDIVPVDELPVNELPEKKFDLDRNFLADRFIAGNGIEIGALHNPLPVDINKATVKYVDRMTVEDLRKQYPELNDLNLVTVDIVADGELLETIEAASQQFVIANHFLEHCQNPILALQNMCRVVKPGGIIFLAIPDKRFSFDKDRVVTTIAHLQKDYENGPQWSKETHFREWTVYVDKIKDEEEISRRVNMLMEIDYSIHFHVWEKSNMDELLAFLMKQMNFRFEITFSLRREGTDENIYILTRLNDE